MKTTVRVEGLKELDEALADFKKATARNILRRVLMKAGEPMRAMAERLAPEDTGKLKRDIAISTKLRGGRSAAKDAYAAARRGGASKGETVAAMRGAGGGALSAEVYVGPKSGNKKDAIKAIVQEVGSVNQAPQAYMRPAFDATRSQVVEIAAREVAVEIGKAKARAARRAARKAMRGG